MTAEELIEVIATNLYEVDWNSSAGVYEFLAWEHELVIKYGPAILPHFVFPEEEFCEECGEGSVDGVFYTDDFTERKACKPCANVLIKNNEDEEE